MCTFVGRLPYSVRAGRLTSARPPRRPQVPVANGVSRQAVSRRQVGKGGAGLAEADELLDVDLGRWSGQRPPAGPHWYSGLTQMAGYAAVRPAHPLTDLAAAHPGLVQATRLVQVQVPRHDRTLAKPPRSGARSVRCEQRCGLARVEVGPGVDHGPTSSTETKATHLLQIPLNGNYS